MELILIIPHQQVDAFREACDFYDVEIKSEQIPETVSNKPYPGIEFTIEGNAGDFYYLGKLVERVNITGSI